MFGVSRFKRRCMGAPAREDANSLLAQLCLRSGAMTVSDKAIWPGGSGAENDLAIFEAAAFIYSLTYIRYAKGGDTLNDLIGTYDFHPDDIEETAKEIFKDAAQVIIAAYVDEARTEDAPARSRFASRVKPYMLSDDALQEFAGVLASLTHQKRTLDFTRDLKAHASLMSLYPTIIMECLKAAAQIVRLELEGKLEERSE